MTLNVYLTLKWLHVTGACIGFGSNVTHLFWLLAASHDPAHRANTLRLVKKLDDCLAVPAYIVAILCGIGMWLSQWPAFTPWLIASAALSAVLAAQGICFGPFMKKWIRLARDHVPGDQALPRLSRRLTLWWIGVTSPVLVILYLMVRKPALW